MSLHLLENVCAELKACQAVGSSREFCESWLARDESYMRVLRFHSKPPSAGALATLASKLGYYAVQFGKTGRQDHAILAQRLDHLRDLCQDSIEVQARAKWMTPERMGM